MNVEQTFELMVRSLLSVQDPQSVGDVSIALNKAANGPLEIQVEVSRGIFQFRRLVIEASNSISLAKDQNEAVAALERIFQRKIPDEPAMELCRASARHELASTLAALAIGLEALAAKVIFEPTRAEELWAGAVHKCTKANAN